MQESTFTNYDQLPLFLNANTVAQVLGVSISSAYELMHEEVSPRCGSETASWCPKKSSAGGSMSRQEVMPDVPTLAQAGSEQALLPCPKRSLQSRTQLS